MGSPEQTLKRGLVCAGTALLRRCSQRRLGREGRGSQTGYDLKGTRVGKLWYDVASGLSPLESVGLAVQTPYLSVIG